MHDVSSWLFIITFISIGKNEYFIEIFLVFNWCPFSDAQSRWRYHIKWSLTQPPLGTDSCWVLLTLAGGKRNGQVIWRMFRFVWSLSDWHLSDFFFFHYKMGIVGFWKGRLQRWRSFSSVGDMQHSNYVDFDSIAMGFYFLNKSNN